MDMDFALFQQVVNQRSDERNVSARFYDKAVKTEKLTDSGLPIFKNVTYVEIRLKDNNTEVFNQPASAEKINRFPQEYALYQKAKEQSKSGTPLEQFAFLNAAEIATCKNRGVLTVEELAQLPFEKVQMLGLENEHILAQMFVEKAQENNGIAVFAQKEKQYKQEISKLNEQIEFLQKQITELRTHSVENNRRKKGERA